MTLNYKKNEIEHFQKCKGKMSPVIVIIIWGLINLVIAGFFTMLSIPASFIPGFALAPMILKGLVIGGVNLLFFIIVIITAAVSKCV